MKYTDAELKVIIAKLQISQVLLVDKENLNQLCSLVMDLLQALQDTNYGTAKNLANNIQQIINNLLPTISSAEPLTDISANNTKLKTPLGDLDLNSSILGNMLAFNTNLKESRERNSSENKQKRLQPKPREKRVFTSLEDLANDKF